MFIPRGNEKNAETTIQGTTRENASLTRLPPDLRERVRRILSEAGMEMRKKAGYEYQMATDCYYDGLEDAANSRARKGEDYVEAALLLEGASIKCRANFENYEFGD